MGTRRAILGLLGGAAGLLVGLQHAEAQPNYVIPQAINAGNITAGTVPFARLPTGLNVIMGAANIQIGGATGDAATISIPASITKYRINGVSVTNCASTPAGSPLVNMWTGAGGTGTQVAAFSSANLTANTTPATITNGTASGVNGALTSSSIIVNVQTAATGAVTCSFYFLLQDLTGL